MKVPPVGGSRSPFAEAPAIDRPNARIESFTAGLLATTAGQSPFRDLAAFEGFDEATALLEATMAELHDEGFADSLAELAEETEQALDDRFMGEAQSDPGERERFGRSYLAPLQFESDQYLATLESGLSGTDPATLGEDELETTLDRYEPESGDLTPAGEEFLGKLVKKAKGVVRKVATVARKVGKLAMPLLGPLLGKLRKLVRPLLERVLRFAIGKLPEPLRPAARTLAARIIGKIDFAGSASPGAASAADLTVVAAPADSQGPAAPADSNDTGADSAMAPSQPTDTQALAESFDLSLAEALAWPGSIEREADSFGSGADETIREFDEIEQLGHARARLIARLEEAPPAEQLAPAIEQFAPVVLLALRTGIRLVGRPKVVSFLAGYLAKMIARWVQPDAANPLARAIVDAGLKMATLEAETGDFGERSSPVVLAAVVEDTVRRLAEAEAYLFEDNDLAEVAIAEAFGEAAAAYLPQQLVRSELQLAPTLDGFFVTHRAGHPRSYAKFSRIPEVLVSARAADSLPGFAGGTVGDAIRAAGGTFPFRARMHIYEARPGTTLGGMVRHDRSGRFAKHNVHPLTRRAAGALLREPGLGVRAPRRFLRSRNRIAAGQRFFVLEPLDQTIPSPDRPGRNTVAARMWLTVNARKGRIGLGFYLSESEAQSIAGALRAGKGHGELLRSIVGKFRSLAQQDAQGDAATAAPTAESDEAFHAFAARAGRNLPAGFRQVLRDKIAAWALPALAVWLRGNPEAFLRAADHTDPGVRLRIRLLDVPGLQKIAAGGLGPTLIAFAAALRGKPEVAISVVSGSGKK